MSAIVPFDHSLVTKSVNFHGHNLLRQLVSDNADQIHSIKLQDIDYKVYQNRATEIRNLGFSRVQEMVEFIASKSDILLVSHPKMTKPAEVEDEGYKDCYKHELPLEYFMHVGKFIRVSELLNTIQRGDILFAEVHCNVESNCAALKILACDIGKHRYLSDIRYPDVKVLLKYEDTVVSKADEDKVRKWLVGTRLRVEVLDVTTERSIPCILVGTMGVTLTDKQKNKVRLGKIQLQDLPPILSVTPDPSLTFLSQCIEKMENYKNPQSIRQLASNHGIDLHSYPSLMSSFRGVYQESEKPKALRKAQVCKWAHKSVAEGVTYFKKGQHEEAFQCLNKALQIDQENVEAFVAKGALLANLGRYEKAIEDFEKALKFNPDHINARKYMCETLVELGKQCEEKSKLNEAEKCYSRCLELNEVHTVAKEALNAVSCKLGAKTDVMKLLKEEIIEKEDSFLEDFSQMENELKKKRLEEEMQPLPQVTEESALLLAFTETTKSQVSEEKEVPLSPLSQKLAIQQSLWVLPSNINPATTLITTCADSTVQDSSINIFSNPPPNWPIPDVTKPPPSAVEYSEDAGYRARVEQFLKELEIRSHDLDKKRLKSRENTQRQKRSRPKERRKRKRRRDSSSGSSSSSSSSSSGSSNDKSDSSSKSSRSGSSCISGSNDDRKTSSKTKKRKKKKSKKKKKASEKGRRTRNETKLPDLALPDFTDLEKKLFDYYKKMEAMKTPQEMSGRKESKGESKDLTRLKRGTHPAFLDDSSDDTENPSTKAASSCAKVVSAAEKERFTKNDTKRKKRTKKTVQSSSSSSSSSTSSSRSKSRSLSRSSRSSRSRSRGHRRSRSRSRSRKRTSRSRSFRYRRRRRRSHSRGRHRRLSRSRPSPHYRRSHSKEALRLRLPKKPKSPPFGYYRNKPFYSAPGKNSAKHGASSTLISSPSKSKQPQQSSQVTDSPLPPLPPQPLPPQPPPIKFEIKKVATFQAKAAIRRHLASNTKGVFPTPSKENTEHEEPPKAALSPDPSSRFGKWAEESKMPTDNEMIDVQCKAPAPGDSLDQFEKFLKTAKQKSLEMMKERNKVFLKPQPD